MLPLQNNPNKTCRTDLSPANVPGQAWREHSVFVTVDHCSWLPWETIQQNWKMQRKKVIGLHLHVCVFCTRTRPINSSSQTHTTSRQLQTPTTPRWWHNRPAHIPLTARWHRPPTGNSLGQSCLGMSCLGCIAFSIHLIEMENYISHANEVRNRESVRERAKDRVWAGEREWERERERNSWLGKWGAEGVGRENRWRFLTKCQVNPGMDMCVCVNKLNRLPLKVHKRPTSPRETGSPTNLYSY